MFVWKMECLLLFDEGMVMEGSKKLLCIPIILSWIVFLPGCATDSSKAGAGTAIGALLGGFLGSKTGDNHKAGRIIAGAALGGLVGYAIGKHMDDNDKKKVAESLEYSKPGETTTWINQKSENTYGFTPGEMYTNSEGYQCRTFVQEAIVNGKPEKVEGTACKEPDDQQWKLS
ncbi:MAG TPA: glycine zipper 2TM domain-containing protein [Chromatiales bacterium]|nr:glycine zipper 2TM domain-containing protein [Thiotrichales bacterium]HIP69051.1 glycine zipper 2TM domain-containing protein [Chromatiales bacterium]